MEARDPIWVRPPAQLTSCSTSPSSLAPSPQSRHWPPPGRWSHRRGQAHDHQQSRRFNARPAASDSEPADEPLPDAMPIDPSNSRPGLELAAASPPAVGTLSRTEIRMHARRSPRARARRHPGACPRLGSGSVPCGERELDVQMPDCVRDTSFFDSLFPRDSRSCRHSPLAARLGGRPEHAETQGLRTVPAEPRPLGGVP